MMCMTNDKMFIYKRHLAYFCFPAVVERGQSLHQSTFLYQVLLCISYYNSIQLDANQNHYRAVPWLFINQKSDFLECEIDM